MRFSLKTLLWGTLAIALAIVVVLSLNPKPVGVQAATVRKGGLRETVQEDGKSRIREKYTVSAPVSGRLSRIELNPGDYLTEQTLLAVILPSDPAILDKRAMAEAQAQVQGAEAALMRANSRVEQARINADLSETKFIRAQKLSANRAASREEYDIAKAERLLANQEIETAEFDAEIAKFELKMAKAALDQFSADDELSVQPFEIFSPIAGRVLRVMQESSTVVGVGTPLVELGDPSNLEIEIDVLSTDAVRIQSGAELTIEHWGGGTPLKANVRVVEPGAFTKVSSLGVEEQRVNVIADFNEPPERIASLGDGYRVEARITVNEIEDALLVPNSALFRHDRKWHVLEVVGGEAVLKPVQIGLQNEEETQIVTGLAEGARVIEYPSDELKPGTRVKVEARR
ncbi:efflux RND transporter periplasmic adaptor subunit [Aporhodopirellula aestuarii]|uniref:HlyD family efflux transporter periplasmic adaptor subunit n=1 Tax=Aporhodopirellula aestuarii TaxID=2950107 RepID=A0ABT0UDY5_9BACT|nr:HlyD family efflux transporter periplasmic adaptor subunit [Aporhodopirellula aestuarii]MCM2374976.1 HlyD family efflux transporter periplasmic adaptor subunit [Aporhodopirellula aestuarii]